MKTYGTALDCIKDFGGVKTKDRNVPQIADRDTLVGFSESVGGVIQNLQMMPCCDCFDSFYMTDVTVYMDRKNS